MTKIKDSEKLRQIIQLLYVEAHKFDNDKSIPAEERNSYALFNHLHFKVDYLYRTKQYKSCWVYIRGHVNMLERYNICTIEDIPDGITEYISINCNGEIAYRGETYSDKTKIKNIRNYSQPTQKLLSETRYTDSGSEATVFRFNQLGDVAYRIEYDDNGTTRYSYTYSPKSIVSTEKSIVSKDGSKKSITVYEGENNILSEEYYVDGILVDKKEYRNGELITKQYE